MFGFFFFFTFFSALRVIYIKKLLLIHYNKKL